VATQNFPCQMGPHHSGDTTGRFQRASCRPTGAMLFSSDRSGSSSLARQRRDESMDTNGPRYGWALMDDRPSRYPWRSRSLQLAAMIGLTPIGKGEASRLARAVVVEAMSELKRLYPGIRTHFHLIRVASWSDTDFSSEDLADLNTTCNSGHHAASAGGHHPSVPLRIR